MSKGNNESINCATLPFCRNVRAVGNSCTLKEYSRMLIGLSWPATGCQLSVIKSPPQLSAMNADDVQTLNCHVNDIMRRWSLSANDKWFGAGCHCDASGPKHWLLPCDVAAAWLKCTPYLNVTNANQLERLLMVWVELMLHTLYSCVRLHSVSESLTTWKIRVYVDSIFS